MKGLVKILVIGVLMFFCLSAGPAFAVNVFVEGAYTESDLRTTRVCHRLARHRLEPRNLRILSSAAEREAALIEQVATPALLSGHGDRREYGLEMVRDLGSLFAQLTQLLFSRDLRQIH